MTRMLPKLLAASALLALTACGESSVSWDRELGSEVDKGQFGNATMNNTLIQTGEMSYTVALAERFSAEVPDTINFAFNSSELSDEARSILKKQADFIRQFPEVRFRVFGHTDKVGSNGYNQRLGLRRAQAAVAYLTSLGISRSRLEAVVSYGETRPIIATNAAEVRNRRTVTEVSGFVKSHPLVLNGKYAEIIWREYVNSAVRPHEGVAATAGAEGG
ncbi:OmpA family protein [Tabrizicola sp.]|jgi:outer membrane protein OmpA-like peptidoglycan-associated protein|uniref:OmpA family protein n=1 Tax=Tabrizicola sp. TaxID=2005166 RepID=UPI001A5F9539|nr:OmpA family protein [Tabrizicola sp.]MBL9063602.1 OmpA family protein [Tabrizicola sp.]